MTLDEILEIVEGEMLVEPPYTLDLERAGASDLMSDILIFIKPNMLLITGLTNPQVIRTAEMAETPAILFVRHKHPPDETLALAREMGIAVMLSPYAMFETAGRLYQAGMLGLGKLPPTRTSNR